MPGEVLPDQLEQLLVGPLSAVALRPYLPWVMAFALFAEAFGVWKRVPGLPGIGRIAATLMPWTARFAPTWRPAQWVR